MPALDPAALPGFLLGLHREAFTGWIALRRQTLTRRFQWQGGKPVRLESSQDREALLADAVRRGLLADADAERLRKQIASRGGDEIAAILASKRIGPKELLLFLSQRVGDALADCLSWREVDVALEPELGTEKPAPPLPLDLAAVLARGMAAHWRPDQVLQALGPRATWFPAPGEDFEARRRPLSGDPSVEPLLGAIDGRTAGYALPGVTSSAAAAAALWQLDAVGAIAWCEEAQVHAAPQETEAPPTASVEPEIEIVVAGHGAQAGSEAVQASGRREKARDDRAEELRKEIEELHRQLGEIDYYTLLGVDRAANPAVVKRAYLKAAKRLHPDAVARLGLEELKGAANEVFAEITKAHTVLSDLDERRAYDASLEGHTAIDAGRLAQAETLFLKGEVMMRAGNFRGALELLEGAVQIWPEEAEYQAALAWTLTRKNPPEIERAVEHFEKALSLGGENPVWMLRMSIALKEKGDSAEAAQLAARARELDPSVRA